VIKKRIIYTLLTAIIIFMPRFIYAQDINLPIISAQSGILMDAKTGQVLYQKNMDEPLFPASITKIMTVLVGLENAKLEDTITMSNSAVFSIPRDSANIALDEGEKISFKDTLYAAMISSANEACNAIAEHVSGNVDEFSKLMNIRAKEAGATHTNFVNANGLHDSRHVTTAYDMAMITKEALKNSDFREIFETSTYEILPTNKQSEIRYLWCTHKMLKETNLFYDKAIGGKTGYTEEALNTLVTVAEYEGRELIVVVLKNSSGNNNYRDTLNLFEYGFSQFVEENLTKSNIKQIIGSSLDDEAFSFLEYNKFLLHKDLMPSDIKIDVEHYVNADNQNIQKYTFFVDKTNELMYSVVSKQELIVENNVSDVVSNESDSNLKPYIKLFLNFIFKSALFFVVILLFIYIYINRNYYWKRIKRRINKKKQINIKNDRNRQR